MKLASDQNRAIAFIIDLVIYCSITIISLFFSNPEDIISDSFYFNSFTYIVIVFTSLMFLYKDSFNGMSFGKWIVGIQVKDSVTSLPPSIHQLALRNLFLLILPIEIIVAVFDSKRQRIIDLQLNTIVVKSNMKRYFTIKFFSSIAVGVLILTFLIYSLINAIQYSKPYKLAKEHIMLNKDIEKSIGELVDIEMIDGDVNIDDLDMEANFEIRLIGEIKDTTIFIWVSHDQEDNWKIKSEYR
jgi:uncharacterized RDD family membrane protein YckC